jgi:hypothetical protein
MLSRRSGFNDFDKGMNLRQRMNILFLFLSLFALVCCGGNLFAADKKMAKARVALQYVSGTYSDYSSNDYTGESGPQDGIKLSGFRFIGAGAIKGFDLELDYRSLKPQSVAYWSSRSEMLLNLSYFYAKFPYVAPILGLYTLNQNGDRTDSAAPPAFMDKNKAVVFGLRGEAVLKIVIIQARVCYLTSLEAGKNFGNEIEVGVGYSRDMKKYLLNIVVGELMQMFNGTSPDENDAGFMHHVRSQITSTTLGVYLRF